MITEELGEGGHAFVFKGVRDGHEAAIKMLKPSAAQEDNLERRFKIEVEALKALDHPNIVGFLDYLCTGGYHYMVLEFMDAGAIDHLLHVNGALEPRYALPIFYPLLDGMAHAHSFGYVHRDLKPNNVLLNKAGEAKVTDFGIAKVLGSGEDLTKKGFVLGTTLYMAPEYLSQGSVTPQTDIYSLGVLLFEMLTNRKPFEFRTDDEPLVQFAKRVCLGKPTPPSKFRPIPSELEKVVMKAIAREPKKRYRTVEKFQADLKRAFPELVERPVEIPDGRPMTSAMAMPDIGVAASPPRRSVSPVLVFVVAAVIGTLVGALGSFLLELRAGMSAVAGLLAVAVVLAGAFAMERMRSASAPAAPAPARRPAPGRRERELADDDASDPLPFHGGRAPSGEVQETNISELNAFLEVTAGKFEGKRYGLRPISRIGRDLRFDIRPHDPEISRHHAMITFTGAGFVVKDTGSTNGTFVNEKKVEAGTEVEIRHDDILRVGRTSMRFEFQPQG